MDPSAIRFRPPEVAFTQELRWVLLRAFGPPGRQLDGAVEPAEALRLAEALQLAPRVASRTGINHLRREMDSRTADRLAALHRFTTARALQHELLARKVAVLAAEEALPLIFLKGMALQLGGIVPAGSRRANDIDILIPRDRARTFHRRLREHGFRPLDLPASQQHLPPLEHTSGLFLEIHFELGSVVLEGGSRSTDAGQLIDAGLCRPVEGWPEICRVPAREVSLAAFLVHGIAQHGHSPAAYPMIRLAADLIDLGFDESEAGPFLDGPGTWITQVVSGAEITAMARLCSGLRVGDGQIYLGDGVDGGALVLLRHMIAGALDQEYRRSLRLAGFLSDGRGKGFAHRLRETLLLTPGQMELSFGRRGSRLTRPLLLLWRPVQLLGRLARHSWRHLAYRMRRG